MTLTQREHSLQLPRLPASSTRERLELAERQVFFQSFVTNDVGAPIGARHRPLSARSAVVFGNVLVVRSNHNRTPSWALDVAMPAFVCLMPLSINSLHPLQRRHNLRACGCTASAYAYLSTSQVALDWAAIACCFMTFPVLRQYDFMALEATNDEQAMVRAAGSS